MLWGCLLKITELWHQEKLGRPMAEGRDRIRMKLMRLWRGRAGHGELVGDVPIASGAKVLIVAGMLGSGLSWASMCLG